MSRFLWFTLYIISTVWTNADAVYNELASLLAAQTEGDTGYDYNDAYETDYYDESGACTCSVKIRTTVMRL